MQWFSYAPVDDHTTNNSLSTAKSITVPANANGVILQAITQNVRVKFKGTATTTTGFQIAAGATPKLYPVAPGGTLSIIEEAATAVLQIQFVHVYEQLS